MVKIQEIHAHNAALSSRLPALVAVFVGGTSGISLSTALALARHTPSPKIFLIGRSQSAAESAIASMKTINPSSQPIFLQADISLLKNVDKVCAEIAAKESRLNLLFMTPGLLTLKGRDETVEGLDRKLSLHYYARMRFISNLMPLLTAAAQPQDKERPALSRVISVLDPLKAINSGSGGMLDFTDLDLKKNFSLARCAAHGCLMNNFFLEHMAQQHPQTSFLHAYPAGVATGVTRELPSICGMKGLAMMLLKPFLVPLEESGERHLFASTSARFTARASALQEEPSGGLAVGSDGVKGSGAYWVNWDGEVFTTHKTTEGLRQEGAVTQVVRHTEEVFKQVCEEGRAFA